MTSLGEVKLLEMMILQPDFVLRGCYDYCHINIQSVACVRANLLTVCETQNTVE